MSVYLAADQLLQLTNQNRLIAELRAEVSAIRMEAETQLNVTNILIEALNKKEEYIAKIQAELADLKARPAMAWRRLDVSTDDLPPGRYLVSVECFGQTIVAEAEYVANQADCPGDEEIMVGLASYRLHHVTHYIPWPDLMPPGGEDAS